MDAKQLSQKIKENIGKVIVGKEHIIDLLLASLLAGGHILIEDVPGIGKTTLASALARSLDCSFKRIQFTPDVLPSDITGFTVPNMKTGEFEFHQGAIMSQIILADEINRTSPKTQSSLLEAMEEGQVTVDGTVHILPQPFMVLATQNPIEFVGTYPLPEAQLDRFFMRISIGYPSVEEEVKIMSRDSTEQKVGNLSPVASANDIIELKQITQNVKCAHQIKEYIANIASFTRSHPDLQLGLSPRGTLALLYASKAWAVLSGRDYVVPDDVQSVIMPVMVHRIVLKPEARLKGQTAESLIQSILDSVDIPV